MLAAVFLPACARYYYTHLFFRWQGEVRQGEVRLLPLCCRQPCAWSCASEQIAFYYCFQQLAIFYILFKSNDKVFVQRKAQALICPDLAQRFLGVRLIVHQPEMLPQHELSVPAPDGKVRVCAEIPACKKRFVFKCYAVFCELIGDDHLRLGAQFYAGAA